MNRLFYQQLSRADVSQSMSPVMPRRSQWIACLTRSMIFVLALWLFCTGNGYAQHAGGPFERMVGQWAGSGTIDLSDGTREPMRCRASYDVPAERRNLQLSIRCASDSYNFNLFSNAVLAGHVVSGTWSESTHGVAGTISGTAEGDHIHAHAESASFTATLTLTTHGNRQSVSIRTSDPNAGIKGVTISMRRGG